MGYKLLIGITLSFTAIFSVIQLSGIYQNWLGQFEYGLTYALLSFIALATFCLIGLYVVFNGSLRNRKTKRKFSKDTEVLRALAMSFVTGALEGYATSKQTPVHKTAYKLGTPTVASNTNGTKAQEAEYF